MHRPEIRSAVLFVMLLVGLLAFDWIFLPRAARKAWVLMATLFVLAGASAFFPEWLQDGVRLVGIGRPVDLVLYGVSVLLVREFFLSRHRQHQLQSQITELTRALALHGAKQRKH